MLSKSVPERLRSLSVVLPAHNEQANIDHTLRQTLAFLPQVAERFEVIVVNDGSRDQTATILAGWQSANSAVKVLTHAQNQGYGAALVTGFRAACGDHIFFMDSDGQFAIDDLAHLLPLHAPKTIVTGIRTARSDGALRSLNAWLYNRVVVRGLLQTTVTDVNCAFKLFPRQLVSDCEPLLSRGALINGEMFCKGRRAGYKVAETAVQHFPRSSGIQTGAKPTVILRMFWEALQLRFKLLRDDGWRGLNFGPMTSAVAMALVVAMMTFWGISKQSQAPATNDVLKAVGRGVPMTGIAEIDSLRHLDAQWYLDIATFGYKIDPGQSNVVFFPLLPLLIRGVSDATGTSIPLVGQMLVLLFTLAASALMARYVSELATDEHERNAHRGMLDPLTTAMRQAVPLLGVMAMLLHPMGIFLYAVYPESLFLMLCLGLLLAWRHKQRGWMIGLTFLLALTRPQGLFVPLAFWAHDGYMTLKAKRLTLSATTIGVTAAAVAAVGLFAGYLQLTTGQPWSFLSKRSAWDADASWRHIPELLAPIITKQYLVAKIAIYATLVGAFLLWRRGERLAALLATLLIVLPLHKGDLGDITRYSLLAVFAAVPFILAIPRVPALVVGGMGMSAYLYGLFLARWLHKLWVG